jgi:hypothetical protein
MAKLSLAKLETRIEELERARAEVDRELGLPEVYSDGTRVKALSLKRSEIESQLSPLEEEWQRRAE